MSDIKAYRKKPVVINALHLNSADALRAGVDWCGGTLLLGDDSPHSIIIETLEGNMTADKGDWLIQGVQGEFYPCKPDIFSVKYEDATARGEGRVMKPKKLEALVDEMNEFIGEHEMRSARPLLREDIIDVFCGERGYKKKHVKLAWKEVR